MGMADILKMQKIFQIVGKEPGHVHIVNGSETVGYTSGYSVGNSRKR